MKPAPAYQLLSTQLRDEVAAGVYRDGLRLPTESELVTRHGVSRQTVRRAFQDLVAEGIVYRVPGRGTYANESAPRYLRQLGSIEDLMSLSEDTTMEVLSGLRRRVDVDAASRLRLDDDVVYTVVFRRLHAGVPFVVTRVHLIEDVARAVLDAPELANGAVSAHTIIGLLEPHLSHPIAEAAQSITVAGADSDVAAAVGCDAGHPMLRVDRLYSDSTGRPVELAVSQFLPEQYTYRVTLRRST
jgi:GntR family transcriptional regulator